MIGNLFIALSIACVSGSALATNKTFNFDKPKQEISRSLQEGLNYSNFYQTDVFSLGYLSYNFGSESITTYSRRNPTQNISIYNFCGYDKTGSFVTYLGDLNGSRLSNYLTNERIKFGLIYRLEEWTDLTYHLVVRPVWDIHMFSIYDINGNLVGSYTPNKCEFLFNIIEDRQSGYAPNIDLNVRLLDTMQSVNNNSLNHNSWECFGFNNSIEFHTTPHTYFYGYDYQFQIDIDSSVYSDLSNGVNPFYTGDMQFQFFYFDDLGLTSQYWYQTGYDKGYSEGNSSGLSTGYTNGYAEGLRVGAGANASWLSLLGGIADTPIVFLRDMFNFELFGMNVAVVILSCLTAVVVFALVKKLWK